MQYDVYFGIPFKPHGRDFDGCDCYGLIRLVLLHEHNIELPIWNVDYTSTRNHDELNNAISARYCNFDEVAGPRAGDVILMRLGSVFPVHIGVMIDEKHFLHIREKENVTCCKISDAKWNRRIAGFYRWRKKENR